MASLKKIIYIVGINTVNDDIKFMSMRQIADHLDDEEGDYAVRYNRVSSQISQFRKLFNLKRIGGRKFFRLSPQGTKFFNKIKDIYDPVLDKLLISPDKIEVI